MNNGTEQKINKKALQDFIVESNQHKLWKNIYKLAQIILTPLIIAIFSMFVTILINTQQAKNTAKITEQQKKSAETIADANRENSRKISESNQRIERLKHINDIFQTFLREEKINFEKPNVDAQRMQIRSLEVYEKDALLFLKNIEEYYQNRYIKEKKEDYKILRTQAYESISKILGKSQIDFSKRLFMNCIEPSALSHVTNSSNSCQKFKNNYHYHQDEIFALISKKHVRMEAIMEAENDFTNQYNKLQFNVINMRQQAYKNYNFSDCAFISVNLYKADFSQCTMKNSLFLETDLQEVSFSENNLTGSIFIKSNLQKAIFKESRLRDVLFVNPIMTYRDADDDVKSFCNKNSCCELEGAQFSLGSLLWTKSSPFDIFDVHKSKDRGITDPLQKERQELYVNLLMHHFESIRDLIETVKNERSEKQRTDLKNLIKNTGVKNQEGLVKRLEGAAKKAKILATPGAATNKQLFSKR